MISQELLLELKQILKEDFGVDLPIKAVAEIATVFIGFYDLLVRVEYDKK